VAEKRESGFVWIQFMKNDVLETEWPARDSMSAAIEAFAPAKNSLCPDGYPVMCCNEYRPSILRLLFQFN